MKANQCSDVFNLAGGGVASLMWPDRMSEGDMQDFNDWLDLMKKKINRVAREPEYEPPSTPV